MPYRTYLRNTSDGIKSRLELWVETLPGNAYNKEIDMRVKHLENNTETGNFIYYMSYIDTVPTLNFFNRPAVEPNSDTVTFYLTWQY